MEPGICPLHGTPSQPVVNVDPAWAPEPVILLAWRCTDPAWAVHTWAPVEVEVPLTWPFRHASGPESGPK
jgi:hypothetical protein